MIDGIRTLGLNMNQGSHKSKKDRRQLKRLHPNHLYTYHIHKEPPQLLMLTLTPHFTHPLYARQLHHQTDHQTAELLSVWHSQCRYKHVVCEYLYVYMCVDTSNLDTERRENKLIYSVRFYVPCHVISMPCLV